MNRNITYTFLILITFLISCSKEQSFYMYFHEKMQKMHFGQKNNSYTLIHTEMNVSQENDAVAIFTEQNQQGEQIFIAYFEKESDKWNWIRTTGTEWNSPVRWTSMHQIPYIYAGTIRDNAITKVYVGNKNAKIITVEGTKRFWYVVSNTEWAEVKIEKGDGTQEAVGQIDEEILKDWHNKNVR
ncbi:hypothetical protein CN568_07000 [Bacillus pseudomycoides]|uniref:hypothetical protein n=2 Tax=Bacillus pseudomycoides TaxID=64104 RepID=UPI000BEB6D9B|nr:hypothetical protein [Bacillus pseudomycoides]PDZ72643.1 hypothetical protein CON58_16440 [Bacillus pseudomycoides]PEK33367.1 hypothetical protein CN691_15465 [Bacillus pseudomycoides]PEK69848.1 hypothetical protein CN593_08080 [Bacillus pseudomycoides]PEP43975.1 hypothetical protein CN565_06355 [Bacillus pseudomycoides]PEP46495.1 hypothetical protein CN568_07000 [Bacillus pseudomycoides]